MTQPISIKTGTVEVSGSISETLSTTSSSYFGVGPDGVSQDHRFELYTISSSASCTSEVGELQIFYNPNHIITTTTPTLLVKRFVMDQNWMRLFLHLVEELEIMKIQYGFLVNLMELYLVLKQVMFLVLLQVFLFQGQ